MGIRAYKIAEELGIERSAFVEKARAVGIELKNVMASVEPDVAERLREKLGAKKRGRSVEARVETGKRPVIRRRKRKVPEEKKPKAAAATKKKSEKAEAPPAQPPPEQAPEAEAESGAEATPGQPGAAPEETPPQVDTPPEAEAAAAAEAGSEAAQGAGEADEGKGGKAAAGRSGRQKSQPREESGGQSRKQFKEVVHLKEQEQIARQMTGRGAQRSVGRLSLQPARVARPPRKRRRDAPPAKKTARRAQPAPEKKVVRVDGEISVGELAKQLGVSAPKVQGKLMALGTMVAVTQTIEAEVAEQIAMEFGFELRNTGFQEESVLGFAAGDREADLQPRAPVVTVMGHVDHGKTSLLDALREAKVVEGEAGGITQHIGAYQVRSARQPITFIDTPGHAAFTAMRARGAQITDIVVLVVAAGEGIMPQTVEAIEHARAAGVPLVVAINKCDLPDADPQGTRRRLMEHGVVLEDFGGDVLAVDISATARTGLDKLVEALLLQNEIIEPKADRAAPARGVVIEAHLSKGRGPTATVLVQEGVLRRGDMVVSGVHFGRVRAMSDDRGEALEEAVPGTPLKLVGLSGVPEAGDALNTAPNERAARELVNHRLRRARTRTSAPAKAKVSLEELFARAEGAGPEQLRLVIKADTQGSTEALRDALSKLATERVGVTVLSAGVGAIGESDVQLAQAGEAIVIGFHVRPEAKARRLAEDSGVEIRSYQVIYEVLDDVKSAMAGLLPPTRSDVVLGSAQVRETFSIPRVGVIAGCYVDDGLVRRGARCRLLRDGVQIYDGEIDSLKRFKDDAREVQSGFECGIGIAAYNDVKIGDTIEAYEVEEKPAEL